MLAKVWQAIAEWYEGEVTAYENEPNSPFVIIGVRTRRHWTATVVRALVEFWLRHWQWTIGTGLVIVGLWAVWPR